MSLQRAPLSDTDRAAATLTAGRRTSCSTVCDSENNPEWAVMSYSAYNVSRWILKHVPVMGFLHFCYYNKPFVTNKANLMPSPAQTCHCYVAIRRSITLKVCCGICTNMLAACPLSPLSCEVGLHGSDSFGLQQLAFDLYVHQ